MLEKIRKEFCVALEESRTNAVMNIKAARQVVVPVESASLDSDLLI